MSYVLLVTNFCSFTVFFWQNF